MPQQSRYESNPVHRNPRRRGTKSQWLIQPEEEEASWAHSLEQGWRIEFTSWGVFPFSSPDVLGEDWSSQVQVRVAKFVRPSHTDVWHGYPVDTAKKDDIPATTVLKAWLRHDPPLFRKREIVALTRQEGCTL